MKSTSNKYNQLPTLIIFANVILASSSAFADTPEDIANTFTDCVSNALEDDTLVSRETIYLKCEAERDAFLAVADETLREYMLTRMDQYIDHVLESRE